MVLPNMRVASRRLRRVAHRRRQRSRCLFSGQGAVGIWPSIHSITKATQSPSSTTPIKRGAGTSAGIAASTTASRRCMLGLIGLSANPAALTNTDLPSDSSQRAAGPGEKPPSTLVAVMIRAPTRLSTRSRIGVGTSFHDDRTPCRLIVTSKHTTPDVFAVDTSTDDSVPGQRSSFDTTLDVARITRAQNVSRHPAVRPLRTARRYSSSNRRLALRARARLAVHSGTPFGAPALQVDRRLWSSLEQACELSCSRALLRLDWRVGVMSHQPTS
jgi:hypothetical protein